MKMLLTRNILLTSIFFQFACIKSYTFSDLAQQGLPNEVNVSRIWMEKDSEEQDYIKIQITNKFQEEVFIRWDRSKIKIADSSLVGMNIQPSVRLTYIKSNSSAIYGIKPLLETEASTFYGERMVSPETLKEAPVNVLIGLEYCVGSLQGGLSPVQCSAEGSGWNKGVVKSVLSIVDAE